MGAASKIAASKHQAVKASRQAVSNQASPHQAVSNQASPHQAGSSQASPHQAVKASSHSGSDQPAASVLTTAVAVVVFAASSLVAVLIMSTTTSPLYPGFIGGDSSIFQVMGKYWAQGSLPYVDLFDHKGPIIFFINAVGYHLTDSSTGVAVVQIAFMFASEIAAYLLLRNHFSALPSLVMAAALPLLLLPTYERGNLTEEYILPLLLASCYCFEKWLGEDNPAHPPAYAFVYGLTIAFAILTRATNAVMVLMGVAIIALSLVVRRQGRNLLQNIALCLLGFALPVIPFAIYFQLQGCLPEALYGTLIYNFAYAAENTHSLSSLLVVDRLYLCFPGILLLVTCLICLFQRNLRLKALFYAAICVPTLYLLGTQNLYFHYATCFLPFYYIAFLLFAQMGKGAQRKTGTTALALVVFVASLCCAYAIYHRDDITQWANSLKPSEASSSTLPAAADSFEPLIEKIDDKSSVVLYEINSAAYLTYDIKPACRYFINQDFQGRKSAELAASMLQAFTDAQPEWIVMTYRFDDGSIIDPLLSSSYTLADSSLNGTYLLFHRNAR